MSAEAFIKDLDIATERLLMDERRKHLGASQIGGKCARAPWYALRHVLDVPFDGRMRRLFDRGHEEEWRFYRWLEAMGIEIRPFAQRLCYHAGSDSFCSVDWDDDYSMDLDDVSLLPYMVETATVCGEGPKQWGFHDHEGHYSGSSDGKILGLAKWFPEISSKGWGLLECKTHNEKSFTELKKTGVQMAKPDHYVQMQEYMKYGALQWALYMAVNKNTDEIYVELVMYRPEVGEAYSDRAGKIIEARVAPPRVSEDPSWFGCRFCDFKRICHHNETPEKNCRSCQFAAPGPDKTWECGLHRQPIPEHFILKGCDKWVPVK